MLERALQGLLDLLVNELFLATTMRKADLLGYLFGLLLDKVKHSLDCARFALLCCIGQGRVPLRIEQISEIDAIPRSLQPLLKHLDNCIVSMIVHASDQVKHRASLLTVILHARQGEARLLEVSSVDLLLSSHVLAIAALAGLTTTLTCKLSSSRAL